MALIPLMRLLLAAYPKMCLSVWANWNLSNDPKTGILACGFLLMAEMPLFPLPSVDAESIDELASRAVAMARLAPQDPFAGCGRCPFTGNRYSRFDLMDRTVPSSEHSKTFAFTVEDAAQSVKGITNSRRWQRNLWHFRRDASHH